MEFEFYIIMVLFFILGFILGKLSMWKALRKENDDLKKEVLILKNHIVTTKRGRILIQGKENK